MVKIAFCGHHSILFHETQHCLHGYTHDNGWLPLWHQIGTTRDSLVHTWAKGNNLGYIIYVFTSLKTWGLRLKTSHIKLLKPLKPLCVHTCIMCFKCRNNTRSQWWPLDSDSLRPTMFGEHQLLVWGVEELYRRCEGDMTYKWWPCTLTTLTTTIVIHL